MENSADNEFVTLTPEQGDGFFDFHFQGMPLANLNPQSNILLDMRNIKYGGTNVVSFILSLVREARQNGKTVIPFNISPQIRQVLEICQLDRAMNLCSDREEALSILR